MQGFRSLLSTGRQFAVIALCLLTLLLQACATSGALTVARDQFRQGSHLDALDTLDNASVSGRDRLLLYLDRGLVSQAAEQYEQSIQAFESALELIDELDYFSTRDQLSSLVSSDWAIRYSGEYSERLWVHTFQMINYLMLDQPQGAAVEARRAVALIDEYDAVLDQDMFTRYLMAMSFEAAGQYDSAMVEYRKLANDFNLPAPGPLKRNEQELIVLVATGFIQPKLPGDILLDVDLRMAFPYYPDYQPLPPRITVENDGRSVAYERIDTSLMSVARDALDQRGKAIAARQALRLAAKYNLANEIEDKDPLAGGIAKLFLLIVEQADTRSWETLPAYLSILRVPVDGETDEPITVSISGGGSAVKAIHHIDWSASAQTPQRMFKLIRVGPGRT